MLAPPVEMEEGAVEAHQPPKESRAWDLLVLLGVWLVLFAGSLFSPPLLDDADATHANAARSMAVTGDLVTLHVNGVRYLEKAPLPYWLVALCFKLFRMNTFAAHLPQAIAVLLLALLGNRWASAAFDRRTGLYTGLATLTAAGVFLFTRILIPEVLLSLLLAATIYFFLEALDRLSLRAAYAMWVALGLAVLTKGLIAPIFFVVTVALYLTLAGDWERWQVLRPFSGGLLFLAIAAPWHILAGLRNRGGAGGHGFFWFYFVNEHVLRFLGRRVPMDYNKLPGWLYWSLHLVWLFPWSLLCPALVYRGFVAARMYARGSTPIFDHWPLWTVYAIAVTGILLRHLFGMPYLLTVAICCAGILLIELRRRQRRNGHETGLIRVETYAERTTLLLTIFSTVVLVFFSLSTNQEYYTFPVYLPLLMLLMHAHSLAEGSSESSSRRPLMASHAGLLLVGGAVAVALIHGLWSSRHLPFRPDIGDLLAHRGVGDYTLSMSHLFDLTGASFAALRLPAILAAAAFAVGPGLAWWLRTRGRHVASTVMVAATSAVFLLAAHLALVRFGPMLSSKDFADKIVKLQDQRAIESHPTVMLFGDQAFGSSIPFYLGRDVELVEGRSTSMLFGSTFADVPPVFVSKAELLAGWGTGGRKVLFVPLERRPEIDALLGARQVPLEETAGKVLVTDRPLLEVGDKR